MSERDVRASRPAAAPRGEGGEADVVLDNGGDLRRPRARRSSGSGGTSRLASARAAEPPAGDRSGRPVAIIRGCDVRGRVLRCGRDARPSPSLLSRAVRPRASSRGPRRLGRCRRGQGPLDRRAISARGPRERAVDYDPGSDRRPFGPPSTRRSSASSGFPPTTSCSQILHAEFTDLANYSLFDDVLPVLKRLRGESLMLGVVSNFEEWLERLLEELGVASFFDVKVVSGVEGFEKPDPRDLPSRAGPGRRPRRSVGVRRRQPGLRRRPRLPGSACSRS